MGRSAIEEKLNHELQLTITSERQVVYILAEIRKLLELENAQGQYPTLNFCCNWALHARLTTSAEARRIDAAPKRFPPCNVYRGWHVSGLRSGYRRPKWDEYGQLQHRLHNTQVAKW